VITGTKLVGFLSPDMAPKNYARHATRLYDAMSGIVFDAMSGVKKQPNFIPALSLTTSANEPSYTKSWHL